MKIRSVQLQKFRCFDDQFIDLDADVVAIYGRNGVGKTAVFDAIEFGLFGTVHRFEKSQPPHAPLRSVYTAPEELTCVGLEFSDETNFSVQLDQELRTSMVGTSGWRDHLDLLYKFLGKEERLPTRRSQDHVSEMFRSTVFLAQEHITRFVEGTPKERFDVLATLAGSAQILRQSDKADRVSAEALKQIRQVDKTLPETQQRLDETKLRVAEAQARIDEVSAAIANAESSDQEKLKEALQEADIDLPVFSDSAHDVELVARALAARIEERIERLDESVELLETLTGGWQRHEERQARLDEVFRIEKKLRESHDELSGKRDAIDAARAVHEAEFFQTVSELNAQQQLVERFGRVNELTTLEKELAETLDQLVNESSILDTQIQQERTTLAANQNQLDTAQIEQNNARRNLDFQVKSHAELTTLAADFELYESRNTKLVLIQADHTVAEDERSHLDDLLAELAVELAHKHESVSRLQNALTELTATLDEKSSLVAQLATLVEDESCPLCGVKHDSSESLANAIERTMEQISDATKSLVEELAGAQAEASALTREGQEKALMRDEQKRIVTNTSQQIADLKEHILDYETRLLDANINSALDALPQSIHAAEAATAEAVADTQETLKSLSQQISSFAGILQESVDSEHKLQQRVSNFRSKQAAKSSEHQVVTRELASLRDQLKTFDRDSVLQIEAKLRTQCAALEDEGRRLSQHREQINEQITAVNSRRRETEEELSELKQAERLFAAEAEALGFAETVQLEQIEQQRVTDLTARQKLMVAAEAVRSYSLKVRHDILSADLAPLRTSAQELTQDIESALEKRAALETASDHARQWHKTLQNEVNRSIEKTVSHHQLRIQRHFKSLIPSQHQFDQVVFKFINDQISLGLQYRDADRQVGEPKFYLSSAQSNVLALAIFLSLSANKPWSNLDTLLLDDPVQHLDDLDAVSFLDTLFATAIGRFGQQKQIVVSTCDRNLYLMMLKKFRRVEREGLTFKGITLHGQTPKGPKILYDHGDSTPNQSSG